MISKKIAILASGSGTNAENIIQYFAGHPEIRIKMILSNKKEAYVLTRAENHNIPTLVFDRPDFYETGLVLDKLKSEEIDLIVLAGFSFRWISSGPFPTKLSIYIRPCFQNTVVKGCMAPMFTRQ